jgi:hypothetical protein
MMKKWLLFVVYVIAIIMIILNNDPILRWLEDDSANNLMLLFGAAVLLALIPVVPYGVVAGIIGAKYGPLFRWPFQCLELYHCRWYAIFVGEGRFSGAGNEALGQIQASGPIYSVNGA